MNTSKWLMSTAVTPHTHTHTGPPREQSAPVCILTRTKELPQSSLNVHYGRYAWWCLFWLRKNLYDIFILV